MKKIKPIPLVAGTWLCLFFLFLPFPTELIPELGSVLTKVFVPVTHVISDTNEIILSDTYSFSDSIHLYIQTALLGCLALLISFGISRYRKTVQLLPWLRLALSFILAFFLIKYGLEKWTRLQFPVPPPNILHAEVGSLDKDILFWSLMGTSKTYAFFMGLSEIIAGLLLFFRRTRFLGGYIALGIFANVFALNLGFDITVKLLSLGLLMTSFFVVTPSLIPVVQLLAGKSANLVEHDTVSLRPVVHRFLKGFAITLILLECIFPLFDRTFSPVNPKTLNHQTYKIISTQNYPENIAPIQYKRLHFHPHGFLITETNDGVFESHPIRLPEGSNQFKLSTTQTTISVKREGDEWLFLEDKTLLWRCKRVRNESLPLLQDDFHWTVEGMLPE